MMLDGRVNPEPSANEQLHVLQIIGEYSQEGKKHLNQKDLLLFWTSFLAKLSFSPEFGQSDLKIGFLTLF